MRFIAKHGNYMIQLRPQRQQGMGDGSIQITQEPIYAKFEAEGLIFEHEIERAEKTFVFNGRYQHIDEATPVDIRYRLSLFDTDAQGYDEETKAWVEAEMIRHDGDVGSFFLSEVTPLPAPFPAWDASEKPAFQLVADLVEMGFDLGDALAYEANFGPKRAAVIEALEETIRDRDMETVEA